MSEVFDPYVQWLGIRDPHRPPNHYRLLGVDLFESDPDVLTNAADRQMAHVRTFQAGRRSAESQRLLNELATAKVCLLNSQRKAEYDAWLHAQLGDIRPGASSRSGTGLAGPEAKPPAAVPIEAPPIAAPPVARAAPAAPLDQPPITSSGTWYVGPAPPSAASASPATAPGEVPRTMSSWLSMAAAILVATLVVLLAVIVIKRQRGAGPDEDALASAAATESSPATTSPTPAAPVHPNAKPPAEAKQADKPLAPSAAATTASTTAEAGPPGTTSDKPTPERPGGPNVSTAATPTEGPPAAASMSAQAQTAQGATAASSPAPTAATPTLEKPTGDKPTEPAGPAAASATAPPSTTTAPPSTPEMGATGASAGKPADEGSKPEAPAMAAEGGAPPPVASTAETAPAGEPKKAVRQPVPNADKVKNSRADIRQTFKDQFRAATSVDEKKVLADLLLKQAEDTRDDPLARYSLLLEASDMAIEAVFMSLYGDAIKQLAEEYEVDAIVTKADAMRKASKLTRPPNLNQAMAGATLIFAREAIRVDRYPEAAILAEAAREMARRANDAARGKEASALAKDIEAFRQVFLKASEAEKVLAGKPDDPEANLLRGKYLCFVKDRWDDGLPFLRKGNNAALRALADIEADPPSEAQPMLVLGDKWLEAVSQVDAESQRIVRSRAAYWYRRALPDLSGYTKTKIERRLQDLGDVGPGTSK